MVSPKCSPTKILLCRVFQSIPSIVVKAFPIMSTAILPLRINKLTYTWLDASAKRTVEMGIPFVDVSEYCAAKLRG